MIKVLETAELNRYALNVQETTSEHLAVGIVQSIIEAWELDCVGQPNNFDYVAVCEELYRVQDSKEANRVYFRRLRYTQSGQLARAINLLAVLKKRFGFIGGLHTGAALYPEAYDGDYLNALIKATEFLKIPDNTVQRGELLCAFHFTLMQLYKKANPDFNDFLHLDYLYKVST